MPGKSLEQRRLVSYSPWGRKRVGNDLATKQQQEEARDAAKHLMMHRTVPMTKKYLSPNVNSAKVKKPCDGGTQALKEQWLGRE